MILTSVLKKSKLIKIHARTYSAKSPFPILITSQVSPNFLAIFECKKVQYNLNKLNILSSDLSVCIMII